VELIEFTMLLPITVFFMIFIINMGTLMVTDGVLHDAAFTAALTGAQNGAITAGGEGSAGTAWGSAAETLSNLGPGFTPGSLSVATATVTNDDGTGSSPVCTASGYTTVQVTLTYQAPLLPGMDFLFNLASGGTHSLNAGSTFALQATGVAQCEIAQQ
jgi:Flp pilus assembly protein TadG